MGGTKASLDRVFEEFGIQTRFCATTAPWADNHGGYTPFEIWMMQMDVTPMHGKPATRRRRKRRAIPPDVKRRSAAAKAID